MTEAERRQIKAEQCRHCIYSGLTPGGNIDRITCDYILITRHRRGCPVDRCDKFKRRKRRRGHETD